MDRLLDMRPIDKKRTCMSERAQNVALSSLFFSFCFPVCIGAFIFALEPGSPGASLLANPSKGSWRGASSPSLELCKGESLCAATCPCLSLNPPPSLLPGPSRQFG